MISVAGALIGSVSLVYPFGRDQGIYAYAGKLLLQGKVDYKFVFDVKPPGVHYLFGLAQFILGESMFNLRIFDIVWETITSYIIFLITYRISKQFKISVLSAVLYIFLYFRLDYWHTMQADGFLNLPFAISILFLLKFVKEFSFVKYFISGIFFGLVLSFKYTLIVFFPLMLIAVLILGKDSAGRKFFAITAYTAGMAVVIGLIFAFYYFNDALSQFIDIQFKQIPMYANIGFDTENKSFIVSNIIRLFIGSVYSPLIAMSALCFSYQVFRKEMDYNRLIIFLWMAASIVSLISQWKFFLYHFLVIIPPIVIGSSLFIERILRYKRKVVSYAVVTIILLIIIVFGAKPYANNFSSILELSGGKKPLSEIYIEKGTTTDSVFMIKKTYKAIEIVNELTNPNDKIFVWGFDPLVYYLSDRDCNTRFIYNFPLCWKGNNEDFRKELIYDLNSNTPKLILIAQKDPLPFISGYDEDSKQLVERFPAFKSILEQRYNFVKQQDDFYYYLLKK